MNGRPIKVTDAVPLRDTSTGACAMNDPLPVVLALALFSLL